VEIGVLREAVTGERRVALAPPHVARLVERGLSVRVDEGAGTAAGWPDEEYLEAGARVGAGDAPLAGVRVVLGVRPPDPGRLDRLEQGTLLVSFLTPGSRGGLLQDLADRGIDAVALERMPRITRAQAMDALSSQATAAGYGAVLLAADHLVRFFPMLTTAAGTIRPARVLVLGAGVAGLQAIATARRLGARVEAYDIRTAAAEQVESLGAAFVRAELPEEAETAGGYARALDATEEERQEELLARHVPRADAVITTALIPGRPAPRLVTRGMVEGMARGSVVVDLAGEAGGNCELSLPGERVDHGGVTILAPLDLPSRVAQDASRMFGANVSALLDHLVPEEDLRLPLDDEIVDAVLAVHGGRVRTPGEGR
jgi:H+-translocating NAD(P) transhydrogenase subunit alpha